MEEYKKKNASYEDFDAMGGIRTRDVCLTSHPVTVRLPVSLFPMRPFFKPKHAYCAPPAANDIKW